MESSSNIKSTDLVLTGLMIALVFIAGNIIKIPTVGGGYLHMGDSMVFLSAVVLGKRRGAFAAAVGMALVDMFGGFYIWAPFTLVIKYVMAYIAAVVIRNGSGKRIVYVIGFVLGGAFMVIGYFIAGGIITAITTNGALKTVIVGAFITSAKDIVGNILQATFGIVVALPLSAVAVKLKKHSVA
ncbi:ECF transporter S component [Clostridium manihotivorum]|uniref:BioY family transporter n=1 Tax=Clostridium manihotivorum TaxID=2320868 RepID=A0A410E026_9CLOT|nr:ECF transporter S component [Clostridium manihotivorum]QAA34680.1 BioY family transporter [Clostridium manihotivorum]